MKNTNQCQERAGFLFKHDCELQATITCGQCGKNFCEKHCRRAPVGSSSHFCVSCVRSLNNYNDPYYYSDPYFYGNNYYSGWGSYDSRSYSSSGTGGSGLSEKSSCGGGDDADIGDVAAVAAATEAGCGGGDDADPVEDSGVAASAEADCGGGDDHDPNDFTEADGEALASSGDEGFETDMEGS